MGDVLADASDIDGVGADGLADRGWVTAGRSLVADDHPRRRGQ